MQLTDKTIVVTGAGSGIGRELTLQLLKRGQGWWRWTLIQRHFNGLVVWKEGSGEWIPGAVPEDFVRQPKGRGTLPDYALKPTVAEVKAKKDVQLAAALEFCTMH